MQLGPVTMGAPSVLTSTKSVSFMERMTPSASIVLKGRNCLPTVELNVQYRMNPVICQLANSICGRVVRSRQTNDREWLAGHHSTGETSYYVGVTEALRRQDLTPTILWIDPYENGNNRHAPNLNAVVGQMQQGWYDEQSALEVLAVIKVLQLYSGIRGFNIRDVLILSSYNAQCQLLRQCLRYHLPDIYNSRDTERLLETRVSTVYGAQGSECQLVIYTPGRDPQVDNNVKDNSLIDNPREVYVHMTRPKSRLIIIGSWHLLHNKSKVWSPITSHFDF